MNTNEIAFKRARKAQTSYGDRSAVFYTPGTLEVLVNGEVVGWIMGSERGYRETPEWHYRAINDKGTLRFMAVTRRDPETGEWEEKEAAVTWKSFRTQKDAKAFVTKYLS